MRGSTVRVANLVASILIGGLHRSLWLNPDPDTGLPVLLANKMVHWLCAYLYVSSTVDVVVYSGVKLHFVNIEEKMLEWWLVRKNDNKMNDT